MAIRSFHGAFTMLAVAALIGCDGGTGSSGGSLPGNASDGGAWSGMGDSVPWNAAVTYKTITDRRDGRVYRIVTIGRQDWMAENLAYNDPTSSADTLDTAAIGLGRRYSWWQAMRIDSGCTQDVCNSKLSASHRGICPEGWRVPGKADWNLLQYTSNGAVHLRATLGWDNPVGGDPYNGTDRYGFRALNQASTWWSADRLDDNGHSAYEFYVSENLCRHEDAWASGKDYIRCIRN